MPYYTGTGTITSTTSTVFSGWVNTTSTATATTIWTTWITTSYTGTGTAAGVWREVEPELSAEELAAHELRVARAREAERARAVASRRAGRRALATLLRFISAAQRNQLRAHGHFEVIGGATGQQYRIRRGRVANIDVLGAAGEVLRRLCAHPAEAVPDSDTMLAQALHLQSAANEEIFVRTANVHPLRR